jgi:hypothetical protein
MEIRPKYEYAVTSADDSPQLVTELMAKWAAAGWELVSGSVCTLPTVSPALPDAEVWHTRYITYWRRPTVKA